MKLLTAMFSIEGENQITQGPAIEYLGLIWLIVGWIENQAEGYAKPKRMIALDPFRLQRLPPGTGLGYAAANEPMPRGLFENPIPSQLAGMFPVLEGPDIKILASEIPTRH
jgi:hypothetical protein